MARFTPFLRAAFSALMLAMVAPTTAGLRADAPAKPMTLATQAGAYTISMAPPAHAAQPAVEHLPNSQLAWQFDHESDGTVAIKGPNGTIWQGNLQVQNGPQTPPSATPGEPSYQLRLYPQDNGQTRSFDFAPQQKPAPDFRLILPPGQSQREFVLPKLTP